jgi:hypothetical protein
MPSKQRLYTMNNVDVTRNCNFFWKFKNGAYPNIYNIKLPYNMVDAIYAQAILPKNRIVINRKYARGMDKTSLPGVTVKGQSTINFRDFNIEIKNLILLERQHNEKKNSTLTLADIRYFFGNMVVRGYFNMTLDINDYEVMKEVDESRDANDADEIKFEAEFKDRYLLPQKAYMLDTINQDTMKPWSALELIDIICKKEIPEFWGGFVKWDGKDMAKITKPDWSDVGPNNQSYQGTPLTQCLENLLKLSRSSATVWVDGKFYVYDNSDDDIIARLKLLDFDYAELTIGQTKITKTDNSHRRSNLYRCEFDTEIETPFIFNFDKYTKTTDELESERLLSEFSQLVNRRGLGEPSPSTAAASTNPGKTFTDRKFIACGNLINVMQLPFGITINSKRYEAGTWVNIDEVFTHYGFSYEKVLHAFYEGMWRGYAANVYVKKKKTDGEKTFSNPETLMRLDSEFNAIINAIEQNLWSTFMINPTIRGKMLSYSFQRAGIAQIITGKRVFSPVWCKWIDFRSEKMWIDKVMAKGSPWIVENNLEYDGKNIGEIMKTSPTSFIPNKTGGNVGVFSVSYSHDARRYHFMCEPGSLKERPGNSLKHGVRNVSQFKKSEKFKLVVLGTVKWLMPQGVNFSKDGNYILEQSGHLAGDSPPIEIYIPDMPARFTWRDDMSSPKDILTSSPINREQLKIYASAHVNIREFTNKDWYIGRQQFRGCSEKLKPFGNCEIAIKFGKTITTILEMNKPDIPTVYQAMDYNSRRWLAGEDVRTDYGS